MAAKTKALGKKPGGLSDRASDVVLVVLSVVIMLLVAYPLYYILVASFSDPYDVYAGKTFLLPSQFTLDGYKAVFSDDSILVGYWNSIKYTVVGTIFSVVMIYITAYPLSNPDLPGRKFFNIFFVITMYFGGGLIPTYLVVRDTGLINTIWAMFLPGGVAVSNMIIARNYPFSGTGVPVHHKGYLQVVGHDLPLIRRVQGEGEILPLVLGILIVYHVARFHQCVDGSDIGGFIVLFCIHAQGNDVENAHRNKADAQEQCNDGTGFDFGVGRIFIHNGHIQSEE